MPQKKQNKKYVAVLCALAGVVAVLLLAALIGDNLAQKNNLSALNEAVENTKELAGGSAAGYMLTYIESNNEVVDKVNREMVFSKDAAGYTFQETTSNEDSTRVYNKIYGDPKAYYSENEENWSKQAVQEGAGMAPYSMTWFISNVSSQRVKSIQKMDRDGKTGYLVKYTRAWLGSNYHGYGTPLSGEITYILEENDGKPVITSVSQKLRATAKADGKQQTRVVEETVYLRPDTLEDGSKPSEYLTKYFDENIKDNWTLVEPTDETAASSDETTGQTQEK